MANMIMRFPGGLPKALTLSYDDGVEQDIRLIEIAKSYGLKGTFNLNSGCFPPEDISYEPGTIHRRMPRSKAKKVYTDCGWEIATHAYTHPSLVRLPVHTATAEVLRDRQELEELFGTVIRGFAYPYGAYDDKSVDVLKSCGICYARTVESTRDFHIPKDWLRMPATCHHDDPMLMELTEKFLKEKKWWAPMLFYVWGHSYEFEDKDNWDVIERFAKTISGKDDIWYAANIEIYDYCKAYSELIFSVKMDVCYNPTATDVWFAYDDKEIYAPAGKEVRLA